jgi:hypothetical protein
VDWSDTSGGNRGQWEQESVTHPRLQKRLTAVDLAHLSVNKLLEFAALAAVTTVANKQGVNHIEQH